MQTSPWSPPAVSVSRLKSPLFPQDLLFSFPPPFKGAGSDLSLLLCRKSGHHGNRARASLKGRKTPKKARNDVRKEQRRKKENKLYGQTREKKIRERHNKIQDGDAGTGGASFPAPTLPTTETLAQLSLQPPPKRRVRVVRTVFRYTTL